MKSISTWDWTTGSKVVADLTARKTDYEWREEPIASPDGESVSCIVKLPDAGFTVMVNEKFWEQEFDKAWYQRWAPDGRLTCLVQTEDEWTVAVDGEPWESRFGFVWNTQFATSGKAIAASVQLDGEYGMAIDGQPWEQMYENANHWLLSADGQHSAAVVQVQSLAQADIDTFVQGVFSVARDGEVWDRRFVNAWSLAFNADASRLAAEVRLSQYDYTIAVDGEPWSQTFQGVWAPCFNPVNGRVVAPVRMGGKWHMFEDGQKLWDRAFTQLWGQLFSPAGDRLAAVAATTLGIWTVVVDGHPWGRLCDGMITDLTFSPKGRSLACTAKDGDKWYVMIDAQRWGGYDRVFAPVFSADEKHCAVRMEQGGRFGLAVDGVTCGEDFDMVWDPVFGPESDRLMIRAVKDGKYLRRVVPLGDILG